MDRLLGERKPLLEEALETEVGWRYYYGFLPPPALLPIDTHFHTPNILPWLPLAETSRNPVGRAFREV